MHTHSFVLYGLVIHNLGSRALICICLSILVSMTNFHIKQGASFVSTADTWDHLLPKERLLFSPQYWRLQTLPLCCSGACSGVAHGGRGSWQLNSSSPGAKKKKMENQKGQGSPLLYRGHVTTFSQRLLQVPPSSCITIGWEIRHHRPLKDT